MAAPLQGRAMAVAMVGIHWRWRWGARARGWASWRVGAPCSASLSGMSLALMAWVLRKVPDYLGQAAAGWRPDAPGLDDAGRAPGWADPALDSGALHLVHLHRAAHGVSIGLAGARGCGAIGPRRCVAVRHLITGLLVDRALRRWLAAPAWARSRWWPWRWARGGASGLIYARHRVCGREFRRRRRCCKAALADAAGEGAEVAQSMLVDECLTWRLARGRGDGRRAAGNGGRSGSAAAGHLGGAAASACTWRGAPKPMAIQARPACAGALIAGPAQSPASADQAVDSSRTETSAWSTASVAL
ncbi:hypothetical protein ACU4GD_32155 [Cupriavidus basilensis]